MQTNNSSEAHEVRGRSKWEDKKEEKDLSFPSGKLVSIIIFCIFANFWLTNAHPGSRNWKKNLYDNIFFNE